MQQVKHSGKVNLFAGQTVEKIFIYGVNTVNKYILEEALWCDAFFNEN